MREVAALDPQSEIHRQLQPLVDRGQDRLGGRVVVVGLAPVDRVGGRPDHHAGGRVDLPRGGPEFRHVPERHRRTAAEDPGPRFATISSRGATAWISPMPLAMAGRICSPLNSICSASPVCISRATRCVPPPPGNSPTLISGSPTRVLGWSEAMRWWQASDSSKAPPRQSPWIAAAKGLRRSPTAGTAGSAGASPRGSGASPPPRPARPSSARRPGRGPEAWSGRRRPRNRPCPSRSRSP